jgi:hypothetical protein
MARILIRRPFPQEAEHALLTGIIAGAIKTLRDWKEGWAKSASQFSPKPARLQIEEPYLSCSGVDGD